MLKASLRSKIYAEVKFLRQVLRSTKLSDSKSKNTAVSHRFTKPSLFNPTARQAQKDTRPRWFCQGLMESVSSALEMINFQILSPGPVVVSNGLTGGSVVTLLFKWNCQRP